MALGLIVTRANGTHGTGSNELEVPAVRVGGTAAPLVAGEIETVDPSSAELVGQTRRRTGNRTGDRAGMSTGAALASDAAAPATEYGGQVISIAVTDSADRSALATAVAFVESGEEITVSSTVSPASRTAGIRANGAGIVRLETPHFAESAGRLGAGPSAGLRECAGSP